MPLLISLSVRLSVCVTFVVFTDYESDARPISANLGSMETGECELTRGTCFVVCRLEVVAVGGCRCHFTESTLTALALRIRKCKLMKNTESRRAQNTPQIPQQPGNRGHLETAYNEARLTR